MTENVSHDLLRCRRWLMNSPSSVAWHCYCVFGDWGDLVFGLKVSWDIFYLINRTALEVLFIKACAIIYLNCFCPTLCNLHQRCHVVLTPRCLRLCRSYAYSEGLSSSLHHWEVFSPLSAPACRGGETWCHWHVYRVPRLHKAWPHGRSSAVRVITGSLLAITKVAVTLREVFSLGVVDLGWERAREREREKWTKENSRQKKHKLFPSSWTNSTSTALFSVHSPVWLMPKICTPV